MSADAPAATPQANVWRLDIEDENGVEALAGEIAALAQAGDLITLSGDLGAGKTTLARALIRRLCADPALEVPSPTFTLMQIYDGVHFPIVHADLYRVQSSDELAELGWEEAAEGALVLVEWADRIGDTIAPDRLDVAMRLDASRGETYREVVLTGHGAFAERLQRARALAHLLAASGWGEATRTFMLGDASMRAYERLQKPDGERAILMISPPRPDGPPVRYGKPYSAIARLAETITPFIAMAQALARQGPLGAEDSRQRHRGGARHHRGPRHGGRASRTARRSPSAIARRRRSSPSCIQPIRRAPFPAPAAIPIPFRPTISTRC